MQGMTELLEVVDRAEIRRILKYCQKSATVRLHCAMISRADLPLIPTSVHSPLTPPSFSLIPFPPSCRSPR